MGNNIVQEQQTDLSQHIVPDIKRALIFGVNHYQQNDSAQKLQSLPSAQIDAFWMTRCLSESGFTIMNKNDIKLDTDLVKNKTSLTSDQFQKNLQEMVTESQKYSERYPNKTQVNFVYFSGHAEFVHTSNTNDIFDADCLSNSDVFKSQNVNILQNLNEDSFEELKSTLLIDSEGTRISLEQFVKDINQIQNCLTIIFLECDRPKQSSNDIQIDQCHSINDQNSADQNYFIKIPTNYDEKPSHPQRGNVIVKYTSMKNSVRQKEGNYAMSLETFNFIRKCYSNKLGQSLEEIVDSLQPMCEYIAFTEEQQCIQGQQLKFDIQKQVQEIRINQQIDINDNKKEPFLKDYNLKRDNVKEQISHDNYLKLKNIFPLKKLYTRKPWHLPDIYEGEMDFFGGRSGYGIYHWPRIENSYEGFWYLQQQSGYGYHRWSEGKYCIGHWKSGKCSTYGVLKFPDGNKYDGEFKENMIQEGFARYDFATQDWYEGNFVNNVREGFGVYYQKSTGQTYKGEWLNNTMHGQGVLISKDGDETEAIFANGAIQTQLRFTPANRNNNYNNQNQNQSMDSQFMAQPQNPGNSLENLINKLPEIDQYSLKYTEVTLEDGRIEKQLFYDDNREYFKKVINFNDKNIINDDNHILWKVKLPQVRTWEEYDAITGINQ